jgi:hypothetical protein
MQRTAVAQRHEDQVALGGFGRLADGFRHFTSLAVAEADAALLVADDDECCETETTAALDDLRDAVDCDELVDKFAVALFAALAVIPRASLFLCHCPFPFSFPGAIGKQIEKTPGTPVNGGDQGPVVRSRKSLEMRARMRTGPSNQKFRPPSRAASARALTRP